MRPHVASLRMRLENNALIEQSVRSQPQADRATRAAENNGRSAAAVDPEARGADRCLAARDRRVRYGGENPALEPGRGAPLRLTEQEVLNQPNPIFPPAVAEGGSTHRERILSGTLFDNVEAVRVRKDGTLVNVSLSAAPLSDSTGKIIGRVAMFADISERKRVEQRQRLQSAITEMLAEAQRAEEIIPRLIQQCATPGDSPPARAAWWGGQVAAAQGILVSSRSRD